MYKRFFAFGCSYTSFIWPTWADILAYDLDIEFYNYGLSGIGNVGIMHEITKADLIHKFNDSDLIIVVWTHWNREDRWMSGRWMNFGCVFNNPVYDRRFIRKYWSYSNDVIKNATAIISVNKMLGNKLAFQGHIMQPGEPEQEFHAKKDEETTDLLNFYMPYIPQTGIFDNGFNYGFDGHPTVGKHLEYVNSNITSVLNLSSLKDSTISRFTRIDNEIHNISHLSINDSEKYERTRKYILSIT